jgi:hypothetical protein
VRLGAQPRACCNLWMRSPSAALCLVAMLTLAAGGTGQRPAAADIEAVVARVSLADGKEISRISLGRDRSVGPMVVANGPLVLERVRCLKGDGTQAHGDAEVTGTDPKSGATLWSKADVGIAEGFLNTPAAASTVLLEDRWVPRGRVKQVHLVDALK